MSEPRTITSTTVGRRGEEVRIGFDEFRGKHYVHLRRWYDKSGEMAPGKGLVVPVALIPWLRRALREAEAAALVDGLLDEEAYEAHDLPLPAQLGGGHG